MIDPQLARTEALNRFNATVKSLNTTIEMFRRQKQETASVDKMNALTHQFEQVITRIRQHLVPPDTEL